MCKRKRINQIEIEVIGEDDEEKDNIGVRLMGLSNLPPGCSVSDIPGNRPEDEAWDKWFDSEIGNLWDSHLDTMNIDIQAFLKAKYSDKLYEAYEEDENFHDYVDGEFQKYWDSQGY